MDDLIPLPRPIRRRRVATPTLSMVARLILSLAAILAVSMMTLPSMARAQTVPAPSAAAQPEPRLRLRGDVTAKSDVLTLGDLIENAPAAIAAKPLFRAPALGATGTIQAARIVEAVGRLTLGEVETGGRAQVSVLRAARRVGPAEIEAAFKRALHAQYGVEPTSVAIRLDGESPNLLAPVALDGQAEAVEVSFDTRSRRLAGIVVLGDRQASLRVSGQALELREVVVLTRPLTRGEAIAAADLSIERRPRDGVPTDASASGASVFVGQVAQRGLSAGTVLRASDAALPDLVHRGESVTIVFEAGGVSLQLVGLANENGRMGAAIAVVNAASKKVLQATVIGPGRVSVGPPRQAAPIVQANAAFDSKSGL